MPTAREALVARRRRVLAGLVLLCTVVLAAVMNRWASVAGGLLVADPAHDAHGAAAHDHAAGGGLTSVVSLLAFVVGMVVLVIALRQPRPR